ncbi:MAG: hypothetical protein KA184_14540 [Candidatus Hydrogenedentes bacterium]|nr:hypothetical protein [Candidatus Hydrogenedentota bacterium]
MLAVICGALSMVSGGIEVDWPEAWRAAWENPPAVLRPLQIVHGMPPEQATREHVKSYLEAGLGGIVCNVSFKEYLKSEDHWNTLVKTVAACREAGLVVWLYDEDGYPSGSAGGTVLESNPDLEAQVLAYDASQVDPFVLRRAYEYTHASNNFYAKRRYPNLIDDAAPRVFIEKTHGAYAQRLGDALGREVVAFFTDEPSLMAVDLGPLDARVVDPPDPQVKPLPTAPWCSDLPKLYSERYGEDLLAQRASLFQGETDADRRVRRQYWALVSDLMAERYFGRIQEWCREHNVASSGHMLREESLVHHPPLYGNTLQCLSRMDIPGMDMLNSDAAGVVFGGSRTHTGWLAAALPVSAAYFNGGRRVMTEVSDFVQEGKATLASMLATAAWQSAFGVTEFSSYYKKSMARILDASGSEWQLAPEESYRRWCDFIGRTNALLRDATPVPRVLLYYPIYDVWTDYLPVAEPLLTKLQSPRLQQIVHAFANLGRQLIMNQTPFVLVDPAWLGAGEVSNSGKLRVRGHEFDAILIPAGSELPKDAHNVVERFQTAGGRVIRGDDSSDAEGLTELSPFLLEPACPNVVLGRFQRDGREILLLTNLASEAYRGRISVPGAAWTMAEPATGGLRPATAASGKLELELPPLGTIILVSGPETAV